jgi:antitoxin Phd
MRTQARWSLQDAKAQFSEVVRRTLTSGPQVVTKNGTDTVVVVSMQEFNKLRSPATTSLSRVLADSPLGSVTLDVDRPRSPGRSVKF